MARLMLLFLAGSNIFQARADSGWRRPAGIDLLALLDPKQDAVRGGFAMAGGVLDLAPSVLMQVPYLPPEEYDLILSVVRKENPGKLVIGLASGASQFDVVIDNFHQDHVSRLELVPVEGRGRRARE